MAAAPLLLLFTSSSSKSTQSLIKPVSAYLHIPIKRYSRSSSSQQGLGEKATSTAEEFQRVAEEKRKQQGRPPEEKSGQGVDSHSQASEKWKEASSPSSVEDSTRRKGD